MCVVALILDFESKDIGRNNNALQGYQNSIQIVSQAMRERYIDWFELAVKHLAKKFTNKTAIDFKNSKNRNVFVSLWL